LVEHFYSNEFTGKVCDLCHTLEENARQFPGLREAHDEWKKQQSERKRLMDSGKYF
jgi:hypothetical protein